MDETQQRVGGYTIVRKLGEGGMGVVYLATDTRLGRPVALKVLRRELAANATDRDRFQREARSAATVEHDNIVPVYDVGETADGSPFIAMPLLRGESLDARLRRDPLAPLALVLKVAEGTASGLAAAHAAGLVHRDIKPANIWLEGDPGASDPAEQVRRCKILDFGLARFVDPGDAQITGSGVILGTPAYMAPEQARGERVDHRADLFSLGVVLYRMATGQPPFAGTTPLSFLVAVTTDAPPPARFVNPSLPPALADLIDQLLSKAPGDRPPSASDVVRTVREVRTRPDPASTSYPQLLPLAEEHSDPDTVPDPRPRPPATRGRWVLVAAVAALLALVPLGAWLAGAFDGKKPEGTVAKADPPQPPTEQPKPPEVPQPVPGVPEQKVAAPANLDADRAAALWVVGIGGCVCINGEGGEISSAKGLPTEPFQLTAVTLTENGKTRDEDFVALAKCRHLFTLGLSGAPVGDAALTHLRSSPVLMYLYLKGTRITSAGLSALADCTAIQELDLSYTLVDDDGLKHLASLSKLTLLYLVETKVTAAGIADLTRALPGCQITWNGGVEKPDADRKAALWVLSAGGSVHINGNGQEIRKADKLPKEPFKLTQVYLTDPVKDADLAALAGCKDLTIAYLVGTGITTEGLMHLKGCTKLTLLNVSGTRVCDQAVPVIKGFAKLEDLSVGRSAVTEEGVKQLAKALPGCRIQHDGGTTGPKGANLDADRQAAGYVLSVGGTVRVDGGARDLTETKELPKEPFRLTAANLSDNKQVTDAGLAAFKECRNLTTLSLNGTPVSDTGLAHFTGCKSLKVLNLHDTKVGDAGLVHFKGCVQLEELALARTPVGDVGLAHLAGCKKLTQLYLHTTQVSDVSLDLLRGFTALTVLELRNAKVTAKGVAELTKALPGCEIVHDGGTNGPAKK